MICDSIVNRCLYYSLSPKIADAFIFYENEIMGKNLQDGKYHASGGGIYASVQTYNTKSVSDSFIESHRAYADIQILDSGTELVGFAQTVNCSPIGIFDTEKDLQKYDGKLDFISLFPGIFLIFFPHDAHMPGISHPSAKDAFVKKIVIKVPLAP